MTKSNSLPTLEGEGHLRVAEVCELLSIARSTWWSWCQKAIAPAPVRLGGVTTWRKSDVRAFIELSAARSTSSADLLNKESLS